MDTQKRLSNCFDEFGADCGEKIRRAPVQSVLIAGGVGYLLRFIPIFAILTVLLRIVLALLKPALVIFGLAQITKCLQSKCTAQSKRATESDLEFPRPLDS